jgi:hypothetical protein
MHDLTTAERVEIGDILGRYGRLIDVRDWAALDTVFTKDAQFEIVPIARPPLNGLAEIQEHMRDAARHPAAHHITNVHVTQTTDDCAHVESMLIAVQPDHSVASGCYRDEFVRTPVGLRIRRRVFDWVLAPRVTQRTRGA